MRFFLLFIIGLFCLNFKGQNNINCVNMAPICTNTGLTFQANSGIPDANLSDTGNNYGCLPTNPNPTWYYLEISQSGNLLMTLSAVQDIDFIMWGPFSNLANAITNCNSYSAADIVPNLPNGCGGAFGPTCTQQGCSYSISNIETPSIDNAIAGEVYVLLVTNYANVVQNISLVKSGGTGSTNCNILNPCSITYLNASISSCDSLTGTYGISGVVEFSNPPNFGALVVKNCSGDSVIFNPPFTSPLNYNINNIFYSGNQNCSITSYFTDDNVCSLSTNSFIEPSCPDSCLAIILTVNDSICNGDSLFIGGAYQSSPGNYVDSLSSAFGCDSIINTVLTINNSSSGIDVQISCDSYTWIDGVTYTSSNFNAKDTLINAAGCDSVVSLNLSVQYSTSSYSTVASCNSYYWNGQTYTNSGLYVNVSTNLAGCTQTDSLDLTITNYSTTVNDTVCDSYTWNGNTFTTSGTYYNPNGSCVDTLNLVVNYSSSSYLSTVACDEYIWNGNTITGTGLYLNISTNSDGCPQYDSLDLTVNYSTFGTDVITACDSYTWIDGVTYTSTNNTATDTLTNVDGCDSIVSLDLTINYSIATNDSLVVCDVANWNGNLYYNSGIYVDTLQASSGCDSVVTMDLVVNYSIATNDSLVVCDVANWNGNLYYNSGIYVDTLQASSGCDSIVTLNLEVSSNIIYVDTIFGCDSLKINGVNYTSSFDYTDTLQTIVGCDSIVSLNINVNYSELVNNIDTICSYELPYERDGFVFDTAGLQTLTLNTLNGCDSTINYFLYTIECNDQIFSINIPNIFTPNGDGENDVFKITGTHFDVVEFFIYNRWNSLLFFTDKNIGWSGRNMVGAPLPDGTYYYLIKIKKYEDYNKSNFTIESYKGSLMLLINN